MAQMTVTPVATHAFLLDGKWIEGGDELEIRAPYDGSVVGRVFQGRREHADAARSGLPVGNPIELREGPPLHEATRPSSAI